METFQSDGMHFGGKDPRVKLAQVPCPSWGCKYPIKKLPAGEIRPDRLASFQQLTLGKGDHLTLWIGPWSNRIPLVQTAEVFVDNPVDLGTLRVCKPFSPRPLPCNPKLLEGRPIALRARC